MDSFWSSWKQRAGAACLWQGEAFRSRWPATRFREESEEPSVPQAQGHPSLWGELRASSSFWGQAHWSCQQRLFYGLRWKVGPFG